MRRLLLAIGAVSVIACGDSTGPGGDPVGSWELETINDEQLPYTFFQFGTIRSEILSGRLIVRSDGTYENTSTTRDTDGSTVTTTTETFTGTWTASGGSLTLTDDEDGSQINGSVSGNTLTFSEAGFEVVYRRD